jgi:hypothetical protein
MKPSKHLSPERIADLLEKQVASNKQTIINVLLKYNETTVEPLVARIVEIEGFVAFAADELREHHLRLLALEERITQLERPWWRRIWK